jgi:hypothetical protein
MLADRTVVCSVCRQEFIFTVQEQLEVLRAVPLDDLLDPPGKEMMRWILPPGECMECEMKLSKRK